MVDHPDRELSAFLDGALAPDERAAVADHLAGCPACSRHLAELRATARLVAALPAPAPGRSLVPRLAAPAPRWLRPVRALGVLGSGVSLFLFLALAIVQSGSSLGGGTSTAEQLAARGQFGAAANAIASDAAAKQAGSASAASAAPAADAAQRVAPAASGAAGAPRAGSAPRSVPARTFGPPAGSLLAVALACALVAALAHRRLRRG